MATPVSTLTPYCSVDEFLIRTDWRTIMQLMGDKAGPSNPIRNTLTDPDSVEGARLLTILMDASGQVEAAVGAAGAYSPTALQTLTGASSAYLKRLVRDLAVWECYQRRPDLGFRIPESVQNAMNLLNAIAGGQNVLGLQENIDAGHMELTTDTVCDPVTRNGIVIQAEGYFGRRANRRLPHGCGPSPGCGPCW